MQAGVSLSKRKRIHPSFQVKLLHNPVISSGLPGSQKDPDAAPIPISERCEFAGMWKGLQPPLLCHKGLPSFIPGPALQTFSMRHGDCKFDPFVETRGWF